MVVSLANEAREIEVPSRIEGMMEGQQHLAEIVARFDPKIVKRCDDGSAADD